MMDRTVRILVTGCEGQVARSLAERAPAHRAVLTLVGRPNIDLAEPSRLSEVLVATGADLIVNAAAYTAVDQAEKEPEIAHRINGQGAKAVAEAAKAMGVPIIQISTDYVFDGTSERPYVETDAVDPLGAYGASKLAGERAVALATPDHVVLRTAWVYGPFGKNFVKTMLRLAEDRDEVAVVADQQGSPTSALDIADGILSIARNLLDRPKDADLRGTFHMVGGGETTWADFAREIFAQSERLGGPRAEVRSITTADFPTPAKRPANSRLDCAKLSSIHGVRLPPWRQSLGASLRRILNERSPQEASR
jgi:dTDP-4-dehydrorhamnose reductase